MKLNQKAPDFSLPATSNKTFSLADLKGKNVILYFYPKDSTPGCTQEGQDFKTHYRKFTARNCVIFGISRDSISSHEKFKEKQGYPFELLSDTEEKVCKMFDVIKQKNMYGKTVMGIERSTFLIDDKGILRHEWRRVKVDGHIDDVLDAVKELSKNNKK